MDKLLKGLRGYHIFIGIGAVFGGLGAIIDPTGKSMGISVEVLKKGPFDDFLIPGLFLFIILGLGSLLAAYGAHKKLLLQGYISGVLSVILTLWIVIQCYMLNAINPLHVIYFILAVLGGVLSIQLSYKQGLFPLNYFLKNK